MPFSLVLSIDLGMTGLHSGWFCQVPARRPNAASGRYYHACSRAIVKPPVPISTGAIMADNRDTSPSGEAVIPVSDTQHAPFIFFDGAPTFGHAHGVFNITISAGRSFVGT